MALAWLTEAFGADGLREFSVRDPEGNLWSSGTYNPHDR